MFSKRNVPVFNTPQLYAQFACLSGLDESLFFQLRKFLPVSVDRAEQAVFGMMSSKILDPIINE
jgi:hypothetical protein